MLCKLGDVRHACVKLSCGVYVYVGLQVYEVFSYEQMSFFTSVGMTKCQGIANVVVLFPSFSFFRRS